MKYFLALGIFIQCLTPIYAQTENGYLSSEKIDQLYFYDESFSFNETQLYLPYDESCSQWRIPEVFPGQGYYENAEQIFTAARGNIAKIIILRDGLKNIIRSYRDYNTDALSGDFVQTIESLLKYDIEKMRSNLDQPSGLVNLHFVLTEKDLFKVPYVDQARLAIQYEAHQKISFNVRKLAERDYSIAEIITVLLHEGLHWNKKHSQADKDAWAVRVAEWTQAHLKEVQTLNGKFILIHTPQKVLNLFTEFMPEDKPRYPNPRYNYNFTLENRMTYDLEKHFFVMQQNSQNVTKLTSIYETIAKDLLEQVRLGGMRPLEQAHMFQWPHIESLGLTAKINGSVRLHIERSLVRYVYNRYLSNMETEWRVFDPQKDSEKNFNHQGLFDLEMARKTNAYVINTNEKSISKQAQRKEEVDTGSTFFIESVDELNRVTLNVDFTKMRPRQFNPGDIEIHGLDLKTQQELIFIPSSIIQVGDHQLKLKFSTQGHAIKIKSILLQSSLSQLGPIDRFIILSKKPQIINSNSNSNIKLVEKISKDQIQVENLRLSEKGTYLTLQVRASSQLSSISLIVDSSVRLVDASQGSQYLTGTILRWESVTRQYNVVVSKSHILKQDDKNTVYRIEAFVPDDEISIYNFSGKANVHLLVHDFGYRTLNQVVLHYLDGTFESENSDRLGRSEFNQCNVQLKSKRASDQEFRSIMASLDLLHGGDVSKEKETEETICSP